MKFIVLLLLIVSCNHQEIKAPPPIPAPVIVTEEISIANILLTATTSECAQVKWKDRGTAPGSYIRGVALTFARQVCLHTEVSPLGTSDKDALSYYNLPASNINLYTLLLGLGMRESSGKYCTGRDASASNVSSASAEAGMFQTSYNSSGASPELRAFTKEYHRKCHLETFKEGITCRDSDWRYWGTGAGLDFQKQVKECPAFAVEYAAMTLRQLRKHYGPINRKEVEFKKECATMLESVKKIVEQNPTVCNSL